MKKVFSLLLAVLMLISALPVAYAADTQDYSQGTSVVYTADDEANEKWTITVPAKLAPGSSGTVTLQGTWPSSKTITVTAQETVTLNNSISGADAKTLAVSFVGISEAGNNIESQKFTESVSVEPIQDAIFGVWSGYFYYNVESAIQEPIAATFSDGTELTWSELKLDENGTKYGYDASVLTDTNTGTRAFMDCKSLTSITIPNSITSIDEATFYGCSSLTSVIIPDSVTSIGSYAFHTCSNLTSVTIPEGVTNVGDYAFQDCTNLTSITIPKGVTNIGIQAFYHCSSLINVKLPSSVTNIERNAFYRCTNLTSITIPESVTNIGEWAFYGCDRLTTVNYTGTAEQWATISIGTKNTCLTSATISYNCVAE